MENKSESYTVTTNHRFFYEGSVTALEGNAIIGSLPGAALGDRVQILQDTHELEAEVIGFNGSRIMFSPLGAIQGLRPGAPITSTNRQGGVTEISTDQLGCAVDYRGQIIKRFVGSSSNTAKHSLKKNISKRKYLRVSNSAPPPLDRLLIMHPFNTGVRAIDTLVTIGKGSRLAVIAEPGVGKSTLLSQVCRNSEADISIIALIGERGREVGELISEFSRLEGAERTIVVVSTSAEAALARVQAAEAATRIAEYFRDSGKNVFLAIDSLTRFARAAREVALASGELPVRRGFPASVFSALASLIERAGNSRTGTLTTLYTVLASRAEEEDPLTEEIKSLTDGHINLSRELAEQGHFPAIDVLGSISRIQRQILSPRELAPLTIIRHELARIKREKELYILSGANSPALQHLNYNEELISNFLRQGRTEQAPLEISFSQVETLAERIKQPELTASNEMNLAEDLASF